MTNLEGTTALVIGGSSGIGKATVAALLARGARVTAVGRDAERLQALERTLGPGVSTRTGDAADGAFVEHLLADLQPTLVVLAAGVTPTMAPVEDQDWASFSAAWNVDMQAAFHVVRAALRLPLSPGATVIIVSSGAAKNASPLSGGYPGAKRMQWLVAGNAQARSDARRLGVRFLAVLPDQLVEGTTIGARASAAYASANGIGVEKYMERFGIPLSVDGVATAIVDAASGSVPAGTHAIAVRGGGVAPLP